MIILKRFTSENSYFQKLLIELDRELAVRNGEKNDFFAKFNTIEQIKHVVVAFEENEAIGCGAMKEFDNETMEIKRMFVPLPKRGKGIAFGVLQELETWALELGYKKCILETGFKMPEAIGLYKKCNYKIISNYGQYAEIESSVCFQKEL